MLQVSCLRLRGLLVCVRADGGCVHHPVQVNEQGLLDGAVRTITPHPEFRLFMVAWQQVPGNQCIGMVFKMVVDVEGGKEISKRVEIGS